MIINNTSKIVDIMEWADKNHIEYKLDILNSQPLHGNYKLVFNNQQTEFLFKIKWGID